MENFKSYKGFQVIGPFYDFTSIIGPNGAGKSNLMDAISFVLGVRTVQLCGAQLKDLFYAFDDREKEQKGRRAFVRLVYQLANGAEIQFTRTITITGAGASSYRIDGNVVTWDVYNARFKSLGILVKARNILVFQAKWYYYILLGLVDVEANFLVVKAYHYSSLTSVMLLDCWSIPSVMLLTWIFLKTKYRFKKKAGVVVCIAGLVLVVFSDVHAGDRGSGSNPLKGDLIVIAGSTLYAISNVSEEFLMKNADRVELMAMLGLFGGIVLSTGLGRILPN